ncbi:MAG: nitrate reductase [Porticoccaceae bacterium]|nr:nitrate reductase [Porticoccaceae bacterium]
MTREVKRSFCRICNGNCGVKITVENDRLVDIRGDHDDSMTLGYACIKGIEAVEAHYAPDRILEPLKRQPDGSFAPIDIDVALDEIAAKLQSVMDSDGPEAIGVYRGGGAFLNNAATNVSQHFLNAIGSPKFYSTITIDQSAKLISNGRLGIWQGGRQPFDTCDVLMLVGTNPLVSIQGNVFDVRNPNKRMKEARARGQKLIVIDPRHTETAKYADVFLQPYPGEDPTLMASLLHVILREGWEDREFCQQWVADLDELRQAVAPFTPEYAGRRAGVDAGLIETAARVFALESKRGFAVSGTGPDMAPRSNLAEHLLECLNVVCGRYLREGEKVGNPGVLQARTERKAQVMSAPRWWEKEGKSRFGDYHSLLGDMPTGLLARDILEPGPGQIKAFICHGSNLVNSVPDQRKITEALRSLELLVSIEPYMNETARLSHYIIPPPMLYERPDLTGFYAETMLCPVPYARYTDAVVPPPAGSKVVEDWYPFWALAKRLGVTLVYEGTPLNMDEPPTTDELLSIVARHCPEDWETLKSYGMGKLFDDYPQYVQPADPDASGRFTTMPDDVAKEVAEVASEPISPDRVISNGQAFEYRLSVRRIRETFNSIGRNLKAIRKRMPYNYAYLNPDDMRNIGVDEGDKIRITSDLDTIEGVVKADPTVRRGVVSMTHGFGTLPEETVYEEHGSSTSMLISTDRDLDVINAMPRMTAIPVNIDRCA